MESNAYAGKGLRPPRPAWRGKLKHRTIAATVLLALGVAASAKDAGTPSPASPASARARHWYEVGKASWYGRSFQGHRTAGGESFDMNALTCAHRDLPLGSWVRVTNLKNLRSVFVRVNDRGPVPGDRIVDLSYAAARAVGLHGVGKVRLETVRYGDPDLARALVAQMRMPVVPGL